ncbi:hypothetical protein LSTR_LSTR007191 [Laodelphax striatellus]|uniref:Uncharacterized protein n=1 Tax=Laodelphax striatellus TaxID=195883 RepID=A0A482WW36_LAOST|nr:hypothetical protein LSTR_LSTR007191 [Laodelphax striatellus]
MIIQYSSYNTRIEKVEIAEKKNRNALRRRFMKHIVTYIRVGLKEGSEMYIPTMIHHSAVTLEGFFGRNADSQLTLQANAPEHFVWTAGRLGL